MMISAGEMLSLVRARGDKEVFDRLVASFVKRDEVRRAAYGASAHSSGEELQALRREIGMTTTPFVAPKAAVIASEMIDINKAMDLAQVVSRTTFDSWRARGLLPSARKDARGKWLYSRDEVIAAAKKGSKR